MSRNTLWSGNCGLKKCDFTVLHSGFLYVSVVVPVSVCCVLLLSFYVVVSVSVLEWNRVPTSSGKSTWSSVVLTIGSALHQSC